MGVGVMGRLPILPGAASFGEGVLFFSRVG